MRYRNIELCCPACKGELEWRPQPSEEFYCPNCTRSYPVVADIPDFRVFPDPYIDLEADRAKGKALNDHLPEYDFEGMINYYYSITDVVPPAHAKTYKRGLMAGVAKSTAALSAWERHSGRSVGGADCVLEIGCGTAPLLVAVSKKTKHIVGVDIALRWLVVARKRLSEAGLDVPLFCACAEALPFPDGGFDIVAAESTIEYLQNQKLALEECSRVLRDGGNIFITTPNRYSLGPDPNVNILAGGYLPEKLLAAMVRRQGGIPPKRTLLTAGKLNRMLRSAGFEKRQIQLADIPEEQTRGFGKGMRWVINGYSRAKNLPVSKQLLYLVGPLFYAVAEKSSILRGENKPGNAQAG